MFSTKQTRISRLPFAVNAILNLSYDGCSFCRPESRFLELIPREESEDSESAIPRLILKRQNTPSDDSTPPKVHMQLFERHLDFIFGLFSMIRPDKVLGPRD